MINFTNAAFLSFESTASIVSVLMPIFSAWISHTVKDKGPTSDHWRHRVHMVVEALVLFTHRRWPSHTIIWVHARVDSVRGMTRDPGVVANC